MLLTSLSLTALPLTAQKILAQCPDIKVRVRLAASSLTHTVIIDHLSTDNNPLVKRGALVHTTNISLLNKACVSGMPYRNGKRVQIAMRAASNPLTAPELLEKALNADNSMLALHALCNPNTPEAARRALASARIDKLVARGSKDDGWRQVRAFEVVLANPWMVEETARWGRLILIAIAGMLDVTKSALHIVADKLGGTRRWTIAHSHPAYNGGDIHSVAIDDLIKLKIAACDIEAINRPEFNETDACNILGRANAAEPHVVGRIVNHYGAAILYERGEQHDRWSDRHKLEGAAWVARALSFVDYDFRMCAQDMRAGANVLGDNKHGWETYIALLGDWHSTYESAARAAIRL